MAEGISFDSLVEDVDYSLGGQSSERAKAENQALLEELERKKKARTLAVPTDDGRVRARLREIGEPITLFGERAPDRRDRLKYVLSQIQAARGGDGVLEEESEASSDEEEEEEFWTPGTAALLEARRKIAEFSLPRPILSIKSPKANRTSKRGKQTTSKPNNRSPEERYFRTQSICPLLAYSADDNIVNIWAISQKFAQLGSQIGDERPISQVRFSPDGQRLVTGSWSGSVKVWDIPSCTQTFQLRGHTDRIGGVAWHPEATLSRSIDVVNLASGGGDMDVHLWSLNLETPLATLKGHQDRVVRVSFHPSGTYLGSASFDGTWRLWDIESNRTTEILLQEGHSKEVYVVQFQDDGALAASGGLDGIGRVWDLRTGRTAMVLDGHAQGIFGIDFSPNGYQIATGSGDDTIRIWDMRSLKALYTIPAHKSTVSDVRFFRGEQSPSNSVKQEDVEMVDPDARPTPALLHDARFTNGMYLASSGYDGVVKIWSADDWQLVRTMPTDAGKVMSVDVSPGGTYVASGSWNRSYQLFARE